MDSISTIYKVDFDRLISAQTYNITNMSYMFQPIKLQAPTDRYMLFAQI